MTAYFREEYISEANKAYKQSLAIYLTVLVFYLIYSAVCFAWYLTLPYQSETIKTVKWCLYPVSVAFVIFSFIYLGVKVKRTKAYKKSCQNIHVGLKEKNTAVFSRYESSISEKDGVEMKTLIFIEWNKYKKENYERKVYVFSDKEPPRFEENQQINFITQGNVLYEYEIL